MPGLYDRLSGWYDWLSSSEHPLVDESLRRLAVCPGERVLDLGPGPGYALPGLARAAQPGGQVYGLDRSAGMLRAACDHLSKSETQAGLVRGDARQLPFRGASFDVLFLSFTLELFPDSQILQVLGECRRVLAPAGRLGIVSLLDVPRPGWVSRAYQWTHNRFPRWVDCHPIDVPYWLNQIAFRIDSFETVSLWGLPVALAAASPAAAR